MSVKPFPQMTFNHPKLELDDAHFERKVIYPMIQLMSRNISAILFIKWLFRCKYFFICEVNIAISATVTKTQ